MQRRFFMELQDRSFFQELALQHFTMHYVIPYKLSASFQNFTIFVSSIKFFKL